MGYPNSHKSQFPQHDSFSIKRLNSFKILLTAHTEDFLCTRKYIKFSILFCYFSDKTLIVWKLNKDESSCGTPYKSLKGHSHFVSDAVISSDGQFCLSGSWDGTLRLWDLTQ